MKVLLIGWYGTETIGDVAILTSIVNIALSLTQMDFYLLSLNPYLSENTIRNNQELSNVSLLNKSNVFNEFSKFDVVVFAGGPLMSIPEMSLMLKVFKKAKKNKKYTIIAGCGFGPNIDTNYSHLSFDILKYTDTAIWRDELSYQTTKDYLTSSTISEDPSLTYLDSYKEKKNKSNDKKILLSLRDWPIKQYIGVQSKNAKDQKLDFEKRLLNELFYLIEDGYKVIPFPMCSNHFGGDDRMYLRSLLTDRIIDKNTKSMFLSREFNLRETIKIFNSCNNVIGMRYHSLLFGIGLGKDLFALNYTGDKGKIASLIDKNDINGSLMPTVSTISFSNSKPIDLTFKDQFIKALETV